MLQNLSKSKLAVLASFQRKKNRIAEGIFPVEGAKSVTEFLNGSFALHAIVADSSWWDSLKHNPEIPEDKCFLASETQLKKLSSLATPPSVIAFFKSPAVESIPKPEPHKFYLLLDGIQDPGNLGTIIRTADWFGIHTIYASKDTVEVFNPKTIMATMGSLNRVRLYYTDLDILISENKHLPVYGTLLNGQDIYSQSLSPEGFLIMGNEGNGIRQSLRQMISNPILIPPANPSEAPESLNVAIATGIALSEFYRSKLK